MAIRNKYLTGTVTSKYLPPGERSFNQVVTESGRPILDAELNLMQDMQQYVESMLRSYQVPSGFLSGQTRVDTYSELTVDAPFLPGPVLNPAFTAETFHMSKQVAVVAGFPVIVEFTNSSTNGDNLIQLQAGPISGGAPPNVKRTDFVFLEVWQTLVAPSPAASGTVTVAILPSNLDTLTIGGVPLTAVLVPPTPGADDFLIGGDVNATAANIISSINDPLNSFTTVVTASVGTTPDIVVLTAATPGLAGNSITLLASAPASLVRSGPTLTGGDDRPNKPAQDKLYRHGNVDSPSAVWLDDDLFDPLVGVETTQRVQVQYRIRATGATEAVNHKTEPDGFSNPAILAQGTQGAPVAGYPFVPADRTSTLLNSDASAYDEEDSGLWLAGDGSSTAATALGSIDGFVYAIPIAHVFRRNDAYVGGVGSGFDPVNNTNGALVHNHALFAHPLLGNIPVGESDHPDALFSDAIVNNDIEDKRKHVSMSGVDYQSELEFQMQSLLDGNFRTWSIDAASKQTLGSGSGDVSTRFLVCDEIGRDTAHGGNGVTSGNTGRGETIRNFDHVSRRFGDQSVVERFVLEFLPGYTVGARPGQYVTQSNPGFLGWHEGDVLHLDLDALNASTEGDFDPSGASWVAPGMSQVTDLAPPGTQITDILSIRHDDGNSGGAVSQDTQVTSIVGIGTGHVELTLDSNVTQVDSGLTGLAAYDMVGSAASDVGSQRRIFLEVELTYPIGVGTTDTPDVTLSPDSAYLFGPMMENDPTQRPTDMEDPTAPRFRSGFREAAVEYIASSDGATTPITDTYVSQNTTDVRTLRRLYGHAGFPVVGADLDASTPASGTITVNFGAIIPGDTITIAGVPITAVAGLPGVDQFQAITDSNTTAANLDAALSNPLNSFERIVSSGVALNVVTVTAVEPGALGNNITFTTTNAPAFALIPGVGFLAGGSDSAAAIGPTTEYGSSSRKLVFNAPLSNPQTLVRVDYFAQDPLPNFGGAGLGYQVALYFRSNAPQTVGIKEGTIYPPGGPLPVGLVVEPLAMSPNVWSGQVGSGGVERPFPYAAPFDQIAVNQGGSTFQGEWMFAATASISISDFDAETGLLSLQPMVSLDGTTLFSFGGLSNPPQGDAEFRAFYDFADDTTYRPTVMTQPLSGVVGHKVFTPFLARATEDSLLYRKNELLLIVLSRWGELDEENAIRFVDTGNTTAAAVYRTRGLLLTVSGGHF